MSAIPDNTLVIVAKYPEPGQVKTRLGTVIGHDRAAALYTAFLRDLAARFETAGQAKAPWALRWACAPGPRLADALREMVGERASIFPQRGADFAERLYHIAEDARTMGARRLAIMSSDAPQIPAALVMAAFAAVGGDASATRHSPARRGRGEVGAEVGAPFRRVKSPSSPRRRGVGVRSRWGEVAPSPSDIALSPAEDGGYSLIALRLEDGAAPPDLFRGITMSTTTVLAETLARARALGLRAALLAPTFDVDEAADLGRLWRTLRDAPALAPNVYAALVALIAAPTLPAYTRMNALLGNEDDHGDIAPRW